MQAKSGLPVVWVEIIDAEVIKDNPNSRKFIFGELDTCFVPTSVSKVDDHILYVDRWFALKKAKEWKGVFIKRTGFTRMRSMTHEENSVDDAMPLIHEVLVGVHRILKILERMPKREQENKELDEATTKIMDTINKHAAH